MGSLGQPETSLSGALQHVSRFLWAAPPVLLVEPDSVVDYHQAASRNLQFSQEQLRQSNCYGRI